VKDTITSVVHTPTHPLLDFVLRIFVVVPKVDARHPPGILFPAWATFVVVDGGIAETKQRCFEKAFVNTQLHTSLLLFRGPPLVGFSGSVVANSVGVKQSISCV
jgi:hypothetical protein